jgi:hypothetical protein
MLHAREHFQRRMEETVPLRHSPDWTAWEGCAEDGEVCDMNYSTEFTIDVPPMTRPLALRPVRGYGMGPIVTFPGRLLVVEEEEGRSEIDEEEAVNWTQNPVSEEEEEERRSTQSPETDNDTPPPGTGNSGPRRWAR